MKGQIEFADVKEQLSKAIFLDRDGVINTFTSGDPDDPASWYVLEWDDFHFIPEALEGLKLLADTDYKVFVVSNQSGIGRGLVSYGTVDGIFARMIHEVTEMGGRIDGYLFCPHAPDIGCVCRKPKPGLIYWFASQYEIDLSKSWMIGDSLSDMGTGENAGIRYHRRILIRNDRLKESDYITYALHDAANLYEAAEILIVEDGNATPETSS